MEGEPQKTKSVDVAYTREIPLFLHDCAAGDHCPYCGGQFEGAKVARYCSRAAYMWQYRRKIGKSK